MTSQRDFPFHAQTLAFTPATCQSVFNNLWITMCLLLPLRLAFLFLLPGDVRGRDVTGSLIRE